MTERHRGVEGINWACMDVRNMDGVADRSIDLAFDKGTFDAMIYGSPWNPLDEVKENTSQYLKEVSVAPLRVLVFPKHGLRFIEC